MKLTCGIAMDLVDIYTNGGASPITQSAVEEHLKTCPACREYYNDYKAIGICKKAEKDTPHFRIEASGVDEAFINESVSRISKRLRPRRTVSTVCGIATALIGVSALLYDLINDYKKSSK